LFGLVPTFGRLSRAGTFPFVASLDRVGPFARNVTDLALLYDAMAGHDAADPACRDRPAESLVQALHQEQPALRVAVASGYFQRGASAEVLQALATCAETLSARGDMELPEAARARAAAYVITASEGAALHLARLRSRAAEFDPAVRDRLIAGALLPASLVMQARKLRRWLHAAWLKLFEEVDIILAPTVPCPAPLIGQKMLVLDGEELPVRANLGLYTQPVTFPGLTVVAVPVPTATSLPVGVQVIAAPWQEGKAMRAALMLERAGVARAPQPA
jgi:aspartyl-tRNA(Asn)/glutamyl-tRNA(Gln) amidotransferase subunit A